MEALASCLQPFFQWLWQTTLAASLVICLILAAQKSLGGRLGPRWSHALWLVLLIRMVIPWAPPSRISLLNLLPSSVRQAQLPPISNLTEQSADFHAAAVSATGKVTTPQKATPSQSVPKATAPRPQTLAETERPPEPVFPAFRQALPLLWLAGAALIGAYLFASNFVLWRIVKRDRPLVNQSTLELFEECKAQMGVQTLVAVVPTGRIRSPALFGFIRPRLLLPHEMLDIASRDEMRYVFLHELAHLKRHDIYLGWLMSLLQVLHWFNPLVWLAFHQMRSDRELACDALVLARTGQQESQEYGRAIVALLRRFSRSRPLPAMAGILESKSQLKRRIAMIARFTNNSYRWSPLAAALIVVLCCISLPDARSGGAAEPSVAKPTGASASGEQPAAPLSGESNVFVDPQTGIRFTKFKTISGPSDVIEYSPGLNLSPNGKFLSQGVRVVPLDGSAPFDLVSMPNAGSGSWSPDGRKVVFYDFRGWWLIEVDPETGRPMGPARKLPEGEYGRPRWSSDSKRIVFMRRDSQVRERIWTLSIESGELSQVTDPFSLGIVSPDGRTVACSDGQGVVNRNSLLVKPVAGGEVRKIVDLVYPLVWSADSEWLVCKPMISYGWEDEIHFIRLADGREVKISTPGYLIRQSPHARKLLFYHGSYDCQEVLKVISAAGGPPAELGWASKKFDRIGFQSWTPDARKILVDGKRTGGEWGLWALPLTGKDPLPLHIDTPLCRQAGLRLLSPDGSRLLLGVWEKGLFDLWVVPVSLTQMQSTGPAVKVFGGGMLLAGNESPTDSWSPDGKKIAFNQKWDIWVALADGENPIQLTKTSERDLWPEWSPDGTMIAFSSIQSPGNVLIRVVPASGGEARVVADVHLDVCSRYTFRIHTWSPDGKELTVASEGMISNFPISGGDARTVVRLTDTGIDNVTWPTWSPDGRLLAFLGGIYQKLYVYRPGSIKPKLASGIENYITSLDWGWSPDSKWISFFSGQTVKTRPEGVLWEMDVEEALAKLAK